MAKNILIDYDLFVDLIKYHCYGGIFETDEMHQSIKDRLECKLDKLAKHQQYTENLQNKGSS